MLICLGSIRLKSKSRYDNTMFTIWIFRFFKRGMSCLEKKGQIQNHTIILLCRLNSLCLEIENCKPKNRAFILMETIESTPFLIALREWQGQGAGSFLLPLHSPPTSRITFVMNHLDLNGKCSKCEKWNENNILECNKNMMIITKKCKASKRHELRVEK